VPFAAAQRVTLEGRVQTIRGFSLPNNVTIHIETNDGKDMGNTPVNSDGEFSIPDLEKLTYTVTVTAEGFETYEQEISLAFTGSTYFLNVFLTPTGQKKEEKAPPSRTDLQAPRDARKEFRKAEHAMQAHNARSAEQHLKKAVALFPCYARAQASLASLMMQRRDLKEAEAPLRQSIHCDPDFTDAYAELGQLLNAQTRFGESLTVLEEGERRKPSEWQFYYQEGLAYYGEQKFSNAEGEFLKALTFNSDPPSNFHVHFANIYLKEAKYPKAYAEMQTYLQQAPKGSFAPQIRNIMQQMEHAGVLSASNKPGATAPATH
jgi:Tfp pilus assembly protein PilF